MKLAESANAEDILVLLRAEPRLLEDSPLACLTLLPKLPKVAFDRNNSSLLAALMTNNLVGCRHIIQNYWQLLHNSRSWPYQMLSRLQQSGCQLTITQREQLIGLTGEQWDRFCWHEMPTNCEVNSHLIDAILSRPNNFDTVLPAIKKLVDREAQTDENVMLLMQYHRLNEYTPLALASVDRSTLSTIVKRQFKVAFTHHYAARTVHYPPVSLLEFLCNHAWITPPMLDQIFSYCHESHDSFLIVLLKSLAQHPRFNEKILEKLLECGDNPLLTQQDLPTQYPLLPAFSYNMLISILLNVENTDSRSEQLNRYYNIATDILYSRLNPKILIERVKKIVESSPQQKPSLQILCIIDLITRYEFLLHNRLIASTDVESLNQAHSAKSELNDKLFETFIHFKYEGGNVNTLINLQKFLLRKLPGTPYLLAPNSSLGRISYQSIIGKTLLTDPAITATTSSDAAVPLKQSP